MGFSLVAFDTDHIKEYVFDTYRLKEIRGASSLLDGLNRREMKRIANEFGARPAYMNGGGGLFAVDTKNAEEFKLRVQRIYREKSKGTATITGVVQDLPPNTPASLDELWEYKLKPSLDLMRYQLRTAKDTPPDVIALPSHPFMRFCNSCGTEYAEELHPEEGQDVFYCASCWEKHKEDSYIKDNISDTIEALFRGKPIEEEYAWYRMLRSLRYADYDFGKDRSQLDRPDDFNEFEQFVAAKSTLGVIYADANNMGREMERWKTLQEIEAFAKLVDESIHEALALAIKRHLTIVSIDRNGERIPIFPFDILLLGGDDILVVTDAAKAMQMALTIAQEFHRLTEEYYKARDIQKAYSLSVGVVLAPIKYPFGLVHEMVESTLKHAKKSAAPKNTQTVQGDSTRINFLKVTGGTEPDFEEVYNTLYHKTDRTGNMDFYATLRPYTPEHLQTLLNVLNDSRKLRLGRTKLHQLREAVLKMNLTTAVRDGLMALLSWRDEPRNYITQQVYTFGSQYEIPRSDPSDPVSGFPRVIFPWFADGINDHKRAVYRTSLLDFIELYDVISSKEENEHV